MGWTLRLCFWRMTDLEWRHDSALLACLGGKIALGCWTGAGIFLALFAVWSGMCLTNGFRYLLRSGINSFIPSHDSSCGISSYGICRILDHQLPINKIIIGIGLCNHLSVPTHFTESHEPPTHYYHGITLRQPSIFQLSLIQWLRPSAIYTSQQLYA